MKTAIIRVGLLLFVLVVIAMTSGNFKEKVKEQMIKEDEKYFVLKARNLHNLSFVLGSSVLFLIPYLDKEFSNQPERNVVLICFALLVLGTVLYTVNKAMVKIEYNNGQITYYILNKVRVSGNINEINIAECVNEEHPHNNYEQALLYKDTIIVFNDGSSIHYQTTMKNAYKLETILKKRGCFKYQNIKK